MQGLVDVFGDGVIDGGVHLISALAVHGFVQFTIFGHQDIGCILDGLFVVSGQVAFLGDAHDVVVDQVTHRV